MKNSLFILAFAAISGLMVSCGSTETQEGASANASSSSSEGGKSGGQSTVVDDVSAKNVVGIAIGSKDHTTLVTAVKAAELVDALSNNGPFTVFAPTNDAFAKVPKEALDNLLKPENKSKLQDVLYDHVFVGVLNETALSDGKIVSAFGGQTLTFALKDGKWSVNGVNILASIPATNGIVHVVDAVLLRPAK